MKKSVLDLFYVFKKRSKLNFNYGFTIVELLVVIVVIGVLAAITIVSYAGIQNRATVTSLVSDLDNASKLLKLDQIVNSAYPTTLAAANSGKGVPASNGTTYNYTVSNTNPQSFCITATKGLFVYNIGPDNTPLVGPCPILRLDTDNTSSYPGTGTNWFDLSGNGKNGSLINGVSYNSANGGILNFDGVDDYIQLPSDVIATSNIRSNGITYAIWMKTTNAATEQRLVGQKPSSGYSDFASGGLGMSSNKAKMVAYDDNVAYRYAVGNTVLQNNTWYFITGTYNSSDQNIRIYVNGVIDGNAVAMATFNRLEVNSTNTIGKQDAGSPYSFSGSIADVRIYSRALSADEIQQTFNALRSRYGI